MWLTLALVLAADPTPDVVTEARAALAPFKKQLKDTLQAELAKSPTGAIEVCSVKAPALAKAASTERITVGRSSERLRNPVNAPRPWVKDVLAQFAREPAGADVHRVVTLPDGVTGYAEPIWIAAPCLVCHGKTVAPALEAQLQTKYPTDAARGYELGQLRGVFWVEVRAGAKVVSPTTKSL